MIVSDRAAACRRKTKRKVRYNPYLDPDKCGLLMQPAPLVPLRFKARRIPKTISIDENFPEFGLKSYTQVPFHPFNNFIFQSFLRKIRLMSNRKLHIRKLRSCFSGTVWRRHYEFLSFNQPDWQPMHGHTSHSGLSTGQKPEVC